MNDNQLIELEEYADLEEWGFGEMVRLLLGLYDYRGVISDELQKELEYELEKCYQTFKDKTKIIEREIVTKRITKKLIWSDDS